MLSVKSNGIAFILSSTSGRINSSIARSISDIDKNVHLSISYTTRHMRLGQQNGKDYHFINHDDFIDMVSEDKFLEYSIVQGHLYGSHKNALDLVLKENKDVFFNVDSQGASLIKKKMQSNVVSIFIFPSSLDSLKYNLESKINEKEINLQKKYRDAINEISHYMEYDYIVINNDFQKTVDSIYTILKAERLKKTRQMNLVNFIENL